MQRGDVPHGLGKMPLSGGVDDPTPGHLTLLACSKLSNTIATEVRTENVCDRYCCALVLLVGAIC